MAPAGEVEQLASRVQSMPQELYDRIYESTFTFYAGHPIQIIHKSRSRNPYKPPSTLAVDRASRKLATASLYPECTFEFELLSAVEEWSKSLLPGHRVLLRDVRWRVNWSGGCHAAINNAWRRVQMRRSGVPRDAIKIRPSREERQG